jgi:hypothetical protein
MFMNSLQFHHVQPLELGLPFKDLIVVLFFFKVKAHYGDPLWGATLHYFPRMYMFECIPLSKI